MARYQYWSTGNPHFIRSRVMATLRNFHVMSQEAQGPGPNAPKSAEIYQKQTENTRLQVSLFLDSLPKLRSMINLRCRPTVILNLTYFFYFNYCPIFSADQTSVGSFKHWLSITFICFGSDGLYGWYVLFMFFIYDFFFNDFLPVFILHWPYYLCPILCRALYLLLAVIVRSVRTLDLC